MKVEVTITDGGIEKTFSLDEEKPEDPNDAVNPILAIAKKYHLDLLGSWSRGCGEAIMVKGDEHISALGMHVLCRMITGEWCGAVPTEDFTGPIHTWVKLVQHYDFPKLPPLDLSLICGAVLAVWERVTMNVSPEGRIVLGGEPDYCPIYGPACKLWRIVKEGTAAAPELACCIDQKGDLLFRVQGSENNEFIHLRPISKRCVRVTLPDGTEKTFASYREALDFIKIYPAYGLSGEPSSKGYEVRPVPPKGSDNIEVILPDGTREFFMTYRDAQDFAKVYWADKTLKD